MWRLEEQALRHAHTTTTPNMSAQSAALPAYFPVSPATLLCVMQYDRVLTDFKCFSIGFLAFSSATVVVVDVVYLFQYLRVITHFCGIS